MTATIVLPDAEVAVRSWLRALAIPGIGRNWFFGFPKTNRPYPLGLVQRVSGTIDSYVDVDDAEVQIDIYGKGTDAPPRASVATIAMRVVAEINALRDGTLMGDALSGGARVVLGPKFVPDDDRTIARYLIGARFTFKGAPLP